MKTFVVTVMLVALYLLYRIAFSGQAETEKGHDIPVKKETDTDAVVVKSRFVRGNRRQPQPTPATAEKSENQTEKPRIFAAGNESRAAVIPSEKLDEVFGSEVNPDDLDIPPDDETDGPDADDEAEELRQTLGKDAEPANGFTWEEMAQAVETVNSPPEGTANEAARILSGLEKTDMFEQMIAGDEGKALRIKAVIERHVQSLLPEDAREDNDNDEYGDFNIAGFLS
ncbi:MAG: hypothetical protein LBT78_09930 [Tannerella sp.]|jgi:hypothetical protein|nr:hypothetical protein [Tannerella sp.]